MASVCEVVIPSIFCRKNQKSHWWPDRRLAKGHSENLTYFRVKGNDHQEGLACWKLPALGALLPAVTHHDDPLDEQGSLCAVRSDRPCCAMVLEGCCAGL